MLKKTFLSNFWGWLFAWIILLAISTFIRLYPLRAHIWDPSHEQATLMVVYNIKQTFIKEILAQAPTMPPALANQLADEKLSETMHKENRRLLDAIEKANIALAHQANAGPQKVFLLESDAYDFYNLTENIIATGRLAPTIKGSKYFNELMCAPFGCWQPFTLHPYWGFIIDKFLHIFNPQIPLMTALAYTPLFTYALILLAFLWVCRVLNYSLLASFLGALFLVLAPINLKRGAFGWFRTDPYNVLFPLILIGCLFLALRPTSKKSGYQWAIVFGLTLSIYALFWQGWGLLFFLGLGCALAAALYNFFITKDTVLAQQNLHFVFIFIAVNFLMVSIFFSPHDYFILFKEGFGELTKFTHRGLDLWPNLFMAVGELKKTSLLEITTSAGGGVFILMSLGGLIYFLRLSFQHFRQPRAIDTLILTIFLVITLTLSLHGERFVLFATIPLSLLAAGAMQRFGSQRAIGLPLAIILFILTLVNANRDIRTILTPIYNSVWDEALNKIKTDSPADSIVNTWWAPGHFIKGIAHRRVPFDGASLDQSAVGYWMANMYLAQDEAQARGILRMLNSSGNKPVEFLLKCGLKLSDATSLLLAIASEDKNEAAETLKDFLNENQVKQLLAMTHSQQPHSYVLVYTELVDSNLMLAFTGRWNIKKIETINASPSLLQDVPPRGSTDFIDYLWSTMGGAPKYSDALTVIGESHHHLIFKENLAIDMTTMDAQIQSTQYGTGYPASVFYLKDGVITEHINPNGNLNYAVVLYQVDNQYTARLMDRALANSLIMKLYYFNGQGLQYFKPLILSHDLTGRTQIKVFKVTY